MSRSTSGGDGKGGSGGDGKKKAKAGVTTEREVPRPRWLLKATSGREVGLDESRWKMMRDTGTDNGSNNQSVMPIVSCTVATVHTKNCKSQK